LDKILPIGWRFFSKPEGLDLVKPTLSFSDPPRFAILFFLNFLNTHRVGGRDYISSAERFSAFGSGCNQLESQANEAERNFE